MIDLFSSISVRAEGVTGSYVQAQVQIHAKDLFTGLFHLDGNDQLVLLFLEGRLIALYRLEAERWKTLPAEIRDETIASASGSLRILQLPEDGLRVYRLLLEADFSGPATIPALRGNELNSYLGRWRRDGKAGLALLREGETIVVLILPAGGMDATEGLLISNSELLTGRAVTTRVRGWGGRPFEVTLCALNGLSEGWREYNLRVSFSQFVQKALKRYEELAGRFLVSDLNEQVNLESKGRGWAISLFGNSLSVREYFETADRAGRVYAALLGVMDQHMDSVVGKKVAGNILSDAAIQLTGETRGLVQDYVLSRVPLTELAQVEEAHL